MLNTGRLLRSVRRALALALPSNVQQSEGLTIEDVNADKVDLIDVVLARARPLPKDVARIAGARGRNVDPDLVDVDSTPMRVFDAAHSWDYESACSPEERERAFRSARYEPLSAAEPSDYLQVTRPEVSQEQGHDGPNPTYGRLGPSHVFWRERLNEPGRKFELGDWENTPCDKTPIQLANEYIAADNAAAARRDAEKRAARLQARRNLPPLLDAETMAARRSESQSNPPPYSLPSKRTTDQTLPEPKRRINPGRKAHNRRRNQLHAYSREAKLEKEEVLLPHLNAPGPLPTSSTSRIPSVPFVPISPTPSNVSMRSFAMSSPAPSSPEPSIPLRFHTASVPSSPPAPATSSPAPSSPAPSSPAPSSPAPSSPTPSLRRRRSRPNPEDSESEEEWPDFGDDETPIDWEAIDALGLTPESIYGDNMPRSESLPRNRQGAEYTLQPTSTGWTGGRAAVKEVVAPLWAWTYFALGPILVTFTEVPFAAVGQKWTVIKDRVGRIIAVCSPLLHWISGFTKFKDEILTPHPFRPSPFMHQTINEVVEFVLITTAALRGGNVRGPHWFHISGHDRQIRGFPDLRAWSKKNTGPLKWLLRKNSPWYRLTNYANFIVRAFFPGIFRRFMRCRYFWSSQHGIKPLYGVFWQFCINWGEERLLVDCWPHVDAANLAIGVCVIYIFGQFNSDEVCWLVIWEAGVTIQLPAGVFLAYPSSLFYHFNINKDGKLIICTQSVILLMCFQLDVRSNLSKARIVVGRRGEEPTPHNTEPLTKRNADPKHWKKGQDIRASAVWFCQGSMYQPSELGAPTMKEARRRGLNVNVNWDDLMERGEIF